MVYVIGKPGCGKCQAMRDVLDAEGIAYVYRHFKDLPYESRKRISQQYRDEEGVLGLPIRIDDPQAYALTEK